MPVSKAKERPRSKWLMMSACYATRKRYKLVNSLGRVLVVTKLFNIAVDDFNVKKSTRCKRARRKRDQVSFQ